MGRPRNWWRQNVVRALKEYPEMAMRKRELQSAAMTAGYQPTPRSRAPSRSTENRALRQLSPMEERWLAAIEGAMEETRRLPNGEITLALLETVYFRQEMKLGKAAERAYIGHATSVRYMNAFINAVAERMELKEVRE